MGRGLPLTGVLRAIGFIVLGFLRTVSLVNVLYMHK